MSDDAKRKGLIFLLLVASFMVLIAATLPHLDLKPGIPLPTWEGGTMPTPTASQPDVTISLSTFFKALLEVVGIIVALYCLYKFLKGVPWKEILGPALRIALLTSLVIVILFAFTNLNITPGSPTADFLPPELKFEEGPPLGSPPAFLVWLVWIGLGIMLVVLGVWFSKRRTQDRRLGDPVTVEAEYAMQALLKGLDFRNVIVQCYQQMSAALQKEQGIELENSMTAREFEQSVGSERSPA